MVYTGFGEPHTLKKTLPLPTAHMFPTLGNIFSAQIIVDGWCTLALVSPTPSKKHYHGPVHTCSQCLAYFFLLNSSLRLVYTGLGEPHTLQKAVAWPNANMFAVFGMVFSAEIIIEGWSTLALMSPTPSKTPPWRSPHMFVVLGIVFSAQIIIDGCSTLGLMSPTPATKHYLGLVCTACHGFFHLGDPYAHATSTCT